MVLMIKNCVSEAGRAFQLTVEANGGYSVLEGLGYRTEQAMIATERKEKNLESLRALTANAPTIEKLCERTGCGKVFTATIYRKKPKYCSRACFMQRYVVRFKKS